MTKRVRMIDQKHRLNNESMKLTGEQIYAGIMTGLLIMLAVLTLIWADMTMKNNRGSNIISYNDFVISDDMKDYMHKQGHGQLFSEQDID